MRNSLFVALVLVVASSQENTQKNVWMIIIKVIVNRQLFNNNNSFFQCFSNINILADFTKFIFAHQITSNSLYLINRKQRAKIVFIFSQGALNFKRLCVQYTGHQAFRKLFVVTKDQCLCLLQDVSRKDCNLAAQLLQRSKSHHRVHKLSEVSSPAQLIQSQ